MIKNAWRAFNGGIKMNNVSREEALEAVEIIKKYCDNGRHCRSCIFFINKEYDFCGKNFLELPCDWNIKMEK